MVGLLPRASNIRRSQRCKWAPSSYGFVLHFRAQQKSRPGNAKTGSLCLKKLEVPGYVIVCVCECNGMPSSICVMTDRLITLVAIASRIAASPTTARCRAISRTPVIATIAIVEPGCDQLITGYTHGFPFLENITHQHMSSPKGCLSWNIFNLLLYFLVLLSLFYMIVEIVHYVNSVLNCNL